MSFKIYVLSSYIYGPSGFARVTREILLGLYTLGLDVRLYAPSKSETSRVVSKEEFAIIQSLITKEKEADVWINVAPLCRFFPDISVSGWKIGFSMFEASPLPASFSENCKICDEIWVPSTFNFQLFQEAGVDSSKLILMPLGVNTNLFSPLAGCSISNKFKDTYEFVYGIISTYSTRKGLDLVLDAHAELFSDIPSVALFIKGDKYGERLFRKDLAELISKYGSSFSILYHFDSLVDNFLPRVYNSLGLFVFPSRGEGFGLPPLEAMSCEIPVIGTAETGMKDYMLEEISYLIKSNGRKIDSRSDWITRNYREALFADPDYQQYKDLVWYVYTHREEAKEKAKKAREFVVENYSSSVFLNRIKERLEVTRSK